MLTFAPTEPAHVVLRLPLPPSANRIWRKGKGGTLHKGDDYRNWIQQAGWSCLLQRPDRIPYRYHILLTLPEQAKDLDNAALKAVNDLLQKQGIITNDRHQRRIGVDIDPARDPSTLLVQLWATDEPAPPPRKKGRAA